MQPGCQTYDSDFLRLFKNLIWEDGREHEKRFKTLSLHDVTHTDYYLR